MRSAIARGSSYKWWVFLGLALGIFTSVADAGSVVVALPTISDHFGMDLPTAQWVVTAYALTISAFLLPMGRLSDMVGRKRIYILGSILFVAGASIAGASTTIVQLILPRILMGIGAAMTQGTSMAMLISAFPVAERGKALGLQMGVVGTGGVGGPMLGGFIVSALGWRGVFFTTALLAFLATTVAYAVLEPRRSEDDDNATSYDWLGAGLSAGALATFLLFMTNGAKLGWGSAPMIALMLGVLVLIGAFVWWELRISSPMLDLRLFRRRLFSLGVCASFISYMGMSSVRFLMPFYLQIVLGFSPAYVGLIIVPAALATIVTGPLGGRLSDRYGWTRFNVGGLMLSAAGLFILSRLTQDSPLGLVMAGMVVQSTGTGTFNAPNNSSILSTVDRRSYGVVSSFLNVVRNSANVTSVAVVTVVVTAVMASMGFAPSLAAVSDAGGGGVLAAFTSGLRIAYLITGSLVLLGMLLSLAKGGKGPSVQPETALPSRDHPASQANLRH